jgi:hypothetical protein
VTIKYDPATGDTIWTKRYNGAADGGDESYAIAIDNGGNVFITGNSDQGATTADIVTIKYTPSGSSTVNVLQLPNFQRPNTVKIDNSGNVFIAGVTRTTGNYPVNDDYITVKYNNNLVFQWSRTYNGTANNQDNAVGAAVDPTGNVFVTGFSYWTGQAYNYVTIKYNPNGDSLNAASYNNSSNKSDLPSAINIDNSGNVVVTGYAVFTQPALFDYLTVKYNSDLSQLWARNYDGTANDDDRATALGIDIHGNVYVTGMSKGLQYNFDYLTLKYNSSGDLMCTMRLNGSGNMNDYALSIAVESDLTFYLTGSSMLQETGLDFYTVRYSLISPVQLTVDAGDDTTIYYGYGEQYAVLTAAANGGNPPYRYMWSNGDTVQTITVSPSVSTYYYVTVTDIYNFTASDSVLVNVNDVRCGKNNRKVLVCHNAHTLCIDSNAVKAHLSHGDQLGNCVENKSLTYTEEFPKEYKLHVNYPNPFNPKTEIRYDVPYICMVTIKIFDITGREVAMLVNDQHDAGHYKVEWDASGYSSGIYFYKIITDSYTETKKMILLK